MEQNTVPPNNNQGPIFILASERSGTNLLRRRLSEWQSVAFGPSPLHLLKHLYYAQPFYGDFSDKKILKTFLKDAIGLSYYHFSPWDVQFTEDDIIDWHKQEWSGPFSAVSVMHAMNTLYARSKGYSTYICKDNNLFDFCYPISNEIPSSKFIYLYRDPRDVVASQLKRPTQTRSVVKLATLWRDDQVKSIQAVNSPILKSHKVVLTSYEDLVTDEQGTIIKISNDLALDGTLQRQYKHIYNEEKADIPEWKNLNRPTNQESLGRYKRQLKTRNINLIEHIVWHQMKYLNYSPDNTKRPNIKPVVIFMEKEFKKFWDGLRQLRRGNKMTEGQKIQLYYIKKIKKK